VKSQCLLIRAEGRGPAGDSRPDRGGKLARVPLPGALTRRYMHVVGVADSTFARAKIQLGTAGWTARSEP